MSSDARVWKDGMWWEGNHDGNCPNADIHRALELEDVLLSMRQCFGESLYWEFRHGDASGESIWLAGYHHPRD